MVDAAHQIHLIGIDRLRRVSASAQWDPTAHRITSGWPVNHRDRSTSTSSAAIRTERKTHLHEALNSLNPIDSEILALRRFEELSNGEAAAVLGPGQVGPQGMLSDLSKLLPESIGLQCDALEPSLLAVTR